MGKIPTGHSASSSARYNPMARPSTPGASPRAVPAPEAAGPSGGRTSPPPGSPPQDFEPFDWNLLMTPSGQNVLPLPNFQEATAYQQMALQHMAYQHMAFQQITYQHMAYQYMAYQNVANQNTANQNVASHNTANQNVASQNTADPYLPYLQRLRELDNLNKEGDWLSSWNGYKLMSPQVAHVISHCNRTFQPNIEGFYKGKQKVQAQVFHDMGPASWGPGNIALVPGPLTEGTKNSMKVPPDIGAPTARVAVHQNPPAGTYANGKPRYVNNKPSIDDHLIAREHPNVEHIIQVPASGPRAANTYITYSGSVPPRHYILVENPLGLPVPPPSPDRVGLPPFRPNLNPR